MDEAIPVPAPATAAPATVVARLQRLQQVAGALAGTLTLDQVAHVVLAAATGLPGVLRSGLAVLAGGGRELRFVAGRQDENLGSDPLAWCALDATADLPLVLSARSGEPLWYATIGDLARRFPGLADHERSFGAQALATVALRVGDDKVGALMLCYERERPFDETERAFLAAFAQQAAHAVHRAQAYEQQSTTAELLQRALLPETFPAVPGLAMAAHYAPAGAGVDVGGDWFDVLPLPDGSVLVAIGDVMGRGIPAATVMGQARSALRAYALLDPTPEVVLSRLDHLVITLGAPEQIVTVLVGLVDPDRASVRLASAGHLPPLSAQPGRAARLLPVPADPPLGLAGEPRTGITVPLPAGGVLALCTDGLVETATRPVDTGLQQLAAALDAAYAETQLPRQLCTRLVADLDDAAADDDRAVLVLMSTAGRQLRSDQVQLPAEPQAAPMGRRWLRAVLEDWTVPWETVDDAVLCLSEVVTNAVIHAGTPSLVTAEMDERRLVVSVTDAGRRGSARPVPSSSDDVRGRGLAVVAAVSTAWNSEARADGSIVWFQLDLPPAG